MLLLFRMHLKQVIALVIVCLILAVTITPTIKILHFYNNQAQIIADFCMNKDKPALKCEGHCYLQKQLAETEPKTPVDESLPEMEIFSPAFVVLNTEISFKSPTHKCQKDYFAAIEGSIKSFVGEIFTPPKPFS